jgi:hypothetical protein
VAQVETYVVHVYFGRRAARDGLAGVVEVVRDGSWHRFASFEELRAVLTANASGPPELVGSKTTQAKQRRRDR